MTCVWLGSPALRALRRQRRRWWARRRDWRVLREEEMHADEGEADADADADTAAERRLRLEIEAVRSTWVLRRGPGVRPTEQSFCHKEWLPSGCRLAVYALPGHGADTPGPSADTSDEDSDVNSRGSDVHGASGAECPAGTWAERGGASAEWELVLDASSLRSLRGQAARLPRCRGIDWTMGGHAELGRCFTRSSGLPWPPQRDPIQLSPTTIAELKVLLHMSALPWKQRHQLKAQLDRHDALIAHAREREGDEQQSKTLPKRCADCTPRARCVLGLDSTPGVIARPWSCFSCARWWP